MPGLHRQVIFTGIRLVRPHFLAACWGDIATCMLTQPDMPEYIGIGDFHVLPLSAGCSLKSRNPNNPGLTPQFQMLPPQGLYDEVKQLFAHTHHGEDEPLPAKVAAALCVSAAGITLANPSDVVKVGA